MSVRLRFEVREVRRTLREGRAQESAVVLRPRREHAHGDGLTLSDREAVVTWPGPGAERVFAPGEVYELELFDRPEESADSPCQGRVD